MANRNACLHYSGIESQIRPKNLLQDELTIKDIWGGIRDQAFVLCTGDTSEEALQKNDILFQQIRTALPDVNFLSLAS